MPSFPITDAHLHLWDPGVLRYPWLDEVPMLNKPFLPGDYEAAAIGQPIKQMIFVQCECAFSQCEDEVSFITRLSAQEKRIKGIVAWAPLESGEMARGVLDRYSDNGLVKGIRRIIQFEPDPGFCLQKGFVEGVQLLAAFNYSFDICVSHLQLPQVVQLVESCPSVQFVLDHFGKPDIKNGELESWQKQIRRLATHENVSCKLSGLVTEADIENWDRDQLVPFYQHALDCFTPRRLLFGGDWPVVLQAASYQQWVDTADWMTASLSPNEREQVFNENAQKIYRIV